MNNLLAIAEQMLVSRLMSSDPPFGRNSKAILALFCLAGLFFVFGLGMIIYAAHIWAATVYAPEVAAALTGAWILGLAILCALIALAVVKHKERKTREMQAEMVQSMHVALELVHDEIEEPVRENPKTSLAVAALAGYAAAHKML